MTNLTTLISCYRRYKTGPVTVVILGLFAMFHANTIVDILDLAIVRNSHSLMNEYHKGNQEVF
jgi:hypothetical protein